MSQKRYLRIVNFDEQLHYKDKNPIWIKLYCSLLDDYEFAQIADQTKFHAVALMILAGRLNNRLPDDEAWLRQKINAGQKINLNLLLEIGFLEPLRVPRKRPKSSFNDGKSNKTHDESSRAVLENSENLSSAEQKKTEENKTEENKTEHITTEQTHELASDAQNGVVVVCDFKNPENQNENPQAVKKNGPQSEFSLPEILKYIAICGSRGQQIQNPHGLATKLYQTGSADTFIRHALYPEKQQEIDREIYGEPVLFTEIPCSVCYGAKMADVDGRGFRPCEHCKNERGKSTGFEPQIREL